MFCSPVDMLILYAAFGLLATCATEDSTTASSFFLLVLLLAIFLSTFEILKLKNSFSLDPMSDAIEKLPPSTGCPLALSEWPTLKSSQSVTNAGWKQADIPWELKSIPSLDHLPSELAQILEWSFLDPSRQARTKDVSRPNTKAVLPRIPEDKAPSPSTCGRPQTQVIVSATGRARERATAEDRAQRKSSSQLKSIEKKYSGFLQVLGMKISSADLLDGTNDRSCLNHYQSAVECTGCFEEFSRDQTIRLSCTHSYCKLCLTSLIITAMQSESSYPPKCCLTEIPLQTVLSALSPLQRTQYREKAAEYATPAGKRWYCPKPECEKWIPPSKLSRIGMSPKCPWCSAKICTICRGLNHPENIDCPQDFGLGATLEAASQEGWQRCWKCRAVVELTAGCRHITCKCSAEFCYVCGLRWKTCSCTEVDQVNRQAEIRQRRTLRTQEAAREEQEIAAAIAEVEAFERRHAELQRQERVRREEERRREEQELARLEQIRLEEVAKRLEQEAEAERQRIAIIRISIDDRISFLRKALEEIELFQRNSMSSRHESSEQYIELAYKQNIEGLETETEILKTSLIANIERRTKQLSDKHASAIASFEMKSQEHEDEVFIQVQIHLRGKENKEEREVKLMSQLRKQQAEDRQVLENQLSEEHESLNGTSKTELEIIERAFRTKKHALKHEFEQEMKLLSHSIVFNREWFEFISKRRMLLLQEHRKVMLGNVDAGHEALGLTETSAWDFINRLERKDAVELDAVESQKDRVVPMEHHQAANVVEANQALIATSRQVRATSTSSLSDESEKLASILAQNRSAIVAANLPVPSPSTPSVRASIPTSQPSPVPDLAIVPGPKYTMPESMIFKPLRSKKSRWSFRRSLPPL